MAYATKENALVKTVRCDRISVGYANIYYTYYDLPKIFILMVK